MPRAGARYYASTQGRFTSADSFGGKISNPQSLNLYAYVLNNPLRWNDPTGHQKEDPKKKEARKYDFDENDALVYADGNVVISESVTVTTHFDDSLPWSGYDLIPVVGSFRRMAWDIHTGHDERALLHFGLASVEGAGLRGSPSAAKFSFRFAQRLFVREVIEETGVIVGENGLATSAEILEALASSESSTTSVVSNLTQTPAAGQQLYVAVGENAEALANSVGAVRGAGQNFAARIPTALINHLQ